MSFELILLLIYFINLNRLKKKKNYISVFIILYWCMLKHINISLFQDTGITSELCEDFIGFDICDDVSTTVIDNNIKCM